MKNEIQILEMNEALLVLLYCRFISIFTAASSKDLTYRRSGGITFVGTIATYVVNAKAHTIKVF